MSNKKVRLTTCIGCGRIIPDTATCDCKKVAQRERNKQKAIDNPELTKLLKSTRWQKFRQYIISRDGGHCQRCLIKYGVIVSTKLEVHHIKPRSKYIELMFDEDNCITLCKQCNTHIGTKEQLDFVRQPIEVAYHL